MWTFVLMDFGRTLNCCCMQETHIPARLTVYYTCMYLYCSTMVGDWLHVNKCMYHSVPADFTSSSRRGWTVCDNFNPDSSRTRQFSVIVLYRRIFHSSIPLCLCSFINQFPNVPEIYRLQEYISENSSAKAYANHPICIHVFVTSL